MAKIGSTIVKNAHLPEMFSIDYGISTHIGQRKINQDEVLMVPGVSDSSNWASLFAIADGMGGHPGGEHASRIACKQLQEFFTEMQSGKIKHAADIRDRLIEKFIRIDRSLRLLGRRQPKLREMGTTLSCLVVTGNHSVIVHVGDGRIYRLRNNYLSCLTVDHTFVQDMIFEGVVAPAQADNHPLRHNISTLQIFSISI